jgi:autophagy-related protein 17
VRVKHSDALDGILESLGSQLVPPDFHEHSAASSLFGSQHSEDEEDAHASVPPSPRHSLSSTVHNVRKEKARPDRQTWKTLRDFVDDQAIEDVLDKMENERTALDVCRFQVPFFMAPSYSRTYSARRTNTPRL